MPRVLLITVVFALMAIPLLLFTAGRVQVSLHVHTAILQGCTAYSIASIGFLHLPHWCTCVVSVAFASPGNKTNPKEPVKTFYPEKEGCLYCEDEHVRFRRIMSSNMCTICCIRD